ncbi:hypothetical protein U1Q18_041283 [Sarracenia purpurea var. burkii]
MLKLMDLTLWLHKEEVKWFSVDEAKTEASELQPFQVRESRIKVAARSVEERDTSNGKKGQPRTKTSLLFEVMALLAIEGKQIPGVEASANPRSLSWSSSWSGKKRGLRKERERALLQKDRLGFLTRAKGRLASSLAFLS